MPGRESGHNAVRANSRRYFVTGKLGLMRRLAAKATSISKRSSAISGSRATKLLNYSLIDHRFGSFSRASTTVRSRFTGPAATTREAVTRFRRRRRRRPSIRQSANFSTTAFAARVHSWRGSSVRRKSGARSRQRQTLLPWPKSRPPPCTPSPFALASGRRANSSRHWPRPSSI